MKIANFVVVFLLATASFFARAAEDETLFQSQTFVAPFTDNVLATSALITNQNEFYDAVEVTIQYEEILPLDCTCQVVAVIEHEIAAGIWVPLGYQFEVIGSGLNAPTRILIVSKDINFSPGTDNFVAVGEGIRISQSTGNVPEKLRLAIYNKDTGTNVIQSLTVSAYAKLFN